MRISKLLTVLSLSLVASIGAINAFSNIKETKAVKADTVDTYITFIEERDDIEMTYDEEANEYVASEVYLGDSEYFLIRQGNELYGAEAVQDWSLFGDGENNTIRMLESGTYNIYLTSDCFIYATADPYLEADTWATDFVQNVGCDNSDPDYGPSGWDWYSSDFQNLSDDAKDILIDAIASNDSTATYIEQAAFIHDLCVNKYGLTIFMYRDGGGSRSIYIPYSQNDMNFNSAALIITIASFTAVTTLLVLLVIKKHKIHK